MCYFSAGTYAKNDNANLSLFIIALICLFTAESRE